jgi:hypothetical protein
VRLSLNSPAALAVLNRQDRDRIKDEARVIVSERLAKVTWYRGSKRARDLQRQRDVERLWTLFIADALDRIGARGRW